MSEQERAGEGRAAGEAVVEALPRAPHEATMLLRRVITGNHEVEVALGRHLQVNHTDFKAMELLLSRGRVTLGELAEALAVSPAMATLVVDRLEGLGHATRRRDEVDRRRIHVKPTPASTARALAVLTPMIAETDAAVQAMTPEEQQAVVDFLRAAVGSLDRVLSALDEG